MPASRLVVRLNALALGLISLALVAAFADQLLLGELPCPLCLLQRAALIAAGLGFLLNLRFGIRPLHYGLAILAALTGAAVAMRQVLLHIAPGDPGFGHALFGLHLYTWAFMAFVGIIFGIPSCSVCRAAWTVRPPPGSGEGSSAWSSSCSSY